MRRSKEVDAWFARYENPMKPVVERIRAIVLGADTRIDECIKWQAPTFTYKGNLASFFPRSKQHASLMFHTGALIPGKHPRLVGGGETARAMKISSVEEANAAKGDIERVARAWFDFRDETGPGLTVKKVAATTKAAPVRKPASSRKKKRSTKK